MLSDSSAGSDEKSSDNAVASGAWARRLIPIVLLAGIGAALALVPMGFKSGMTTGRSVAHTPGQ